MEKKSRYKFGKQTNVLEFETWKTKIETAKINDEAKAFAWLLYYCGVRKSEAYERVAEDVVITDAMFIIDFHKRKKHGAEVPPLKIPLSWPGVDLLVSVCEKARSRRAFRKRIYYQEATGKSREGKKGTQLPINKRTNKLMKGHWLFPRINERWAIVIIKRILGEKFYPHYLRLNRITEISTDPTVNIARIKSFTGITTIKAIESYLGVSEKEQDAALGYMDTKINKRPPA